MCLKKHKYSFNFKTIKTKLNTFYDFLFVILEETKQNNQIKEKRISYKFSINLISKQHHTLIMT